VFERAKELALKVLPGTNESYAELLERANRFKSETLSKVDTTEPIVVITHSGMINALKSDHINEKGKLNNGEHMGLCSFHEIKI
jgi:broad specificity phosphatase PhoE